MLKHFSAGLKEWLLIVFGAAILLSALFLPLKYALADDWMEEEERLMEACRKGEIIRIHVIANSDSAEDQAIKLKVRDALIEAFGQLIAGCSEAGSDALYRLLQEKCGEMQSTAQAAALENGFEGPVRAEAGVLHLPSRQYGNVTLPEGEYRALRVALGEGKGQNWWCVLYPQLCLALSETGEQADTRLFWASERIFRHWLITGI